MNVSYVVANPRRITFCCIQSLHVLPRECARVASGSLHVLHRGVCKCPYFIRERVYAYTLPPGFSLGSSYSSIRQCAILVYRLICVDLTDSQKFFVARCCYNLYGILWFCGIFFVENLELSFLFLIFAASLVSPMGCSGRSYFMRKTFSNRNKHLRLFCIISKPKTICLTANPGV